MVGHSRNRNQKQVAPKMPGWHHNSEFLKAGQLSVSGPQVEILFYCSRLECPLVDAALLGMLLR